VVLWCWPLALSVVLGSECFVRLERVAGRECDGVIRSFMGLLAWIGNKEEYYVGKKERKKNNP
jgi:hypothetical protein